MKNQRYILIDPPSGWMYGFPKIIKLGATPDEKKKLMLDSGYPEKDLEFALRHMRTLYLKDEDFYEENVQNGTDDT